MILPRITDVNHVNVAAGPGTLITMTRRELIAIGPVLAVAGCSSAPEPKVEVKPPEPVTGLHALYGMYTYARTWAQDLQVVSCVSIAITQVKAVPGKAAAWQATFASPSLGQKRTYTSSVFDASPSLRSGIFADGATALTTDTRPFVLAGARTDTDQAWETALKHGEAFNTKNPGMIISFILELSRTRNEPVWRVIWGENPAASSLAIVIDAATGEYVQTLT
jgi:hypothetical protein